MFGCISVTLVLFVTTSIYTAVTLQCATAFSLEARWVKLKPPLKASDTEWNWKFLDQTNDRSVPTKSRTKLATSQREILAASLYYPPSILEEIQESVELVKGTFDAVQDFLVHKYPETRLHRAGGEGIRQGEVVAQTVILKLNLDSKYVGSSVL